MYMTLINFTQAHKDREGFIGETYIRITNPYTHSIKISLIYRGNIRQVSKRFNLAATPYSKNSISLIETISKMLNKFF